MSESAITPSWREALNAVEDSGFRRRPVLPFGLARIDARLRDGGLRLDALHEVAGASRDLLDDAAATLFVAGIAARAWGPVLWVVRRRELFAPDLAGAGLLPDRVIHAEAADDAGVLAIMAEGLRHSGLGAVVGEVQRATLPATQRLQLAAQSGRTIALLIRRPRRTGDPFGAPSAAVTRWRVGVTGRSRWQLNLAHQQEGGDFDQRVVACDATGRCALPVRTVQRELVTELAA